ncbi:hypothetical protein C8F01DRAFT_1258044 [Mycena amicta]|nr:hypothetical protein C8F01DRAFT_1324115 [Mycena amicta]KAJ7056240.1 hypothetical protein C8F01DRAFT_1258044 [Mycena amicta]
MTTAAPYCATCDKVFADSVAFQVHIASSPNHPCCEPCGRRFKNMHTLSMHLQCAAAHLPGEIEIAIEDHDPLDGDDVLMGYPCGDSDFSPPSWYGREDQEHSDGDCWWSDSDSEGEGSCSSTTSESEAASTDVESEFEFDEMPVGFSKEIDGVLLAEPGSDYEESHDGKNFVHSSANPSSCYCAITGKVSAEVLGAADRMGMRVA